MLEHRSDRQLPFLLAFGKRPAEELYDLKNDSSQIVNVAAEARYRIRKQALSDRLEEYLKETNDPRMGSDGGVFDRTPIWHAIPRSDPRSYERLERGSSNQH